MRFIISNTPDRSFQLFSCWEFFSVSLAKSVADQTRGKVDTLTNARAVEIFRKIERESKIFSLCSKPVVLLPASLLGLAGSFYIPAASVALLIARIGLATLFGGLFGYAIENGIFSTFLTNLSDAFLSQANAARQAAAVVANSREQLAFELEMPPAPDSLPLRNQEDRDRQSRFRLGTGPV